MSLTSEASPDPLLERLDRLTAILELALAPQIEEARKRLRADPVDAAIFDATAAGWIAAADVHSQVAADAKAKQRTIQTHLGELVAAGHLQQRGGKRYSQYRSMGLI